MMAAAHIDTIKRTIKIEGGKFLTFVLDNEAYGIEILKVREIISLSNITKVPQTPTYMKGVISLRGKVIPVIDLRLKFCLPEIEYTKETCIIIVAIKDIFMGIIVDHVSEVLDINNESIEPPPSLGNSVHIDFLLGIGKVKDKIILLLDIGKVISEEEIAAISNF